MSVHPGEPEVVGGRSGQRVSPSVGGSSETGYSASSVGGTVRPSPFADFRIELLAWLDAEKLELDHHPDAAARDQLA
jgi:hypothetical protein